MANALDVSSGLAQPLAAFVQASGDVNVLLWIVYAGLAVAGAVTLLLATRMIAARRSAELTVRRARGASLAQLFSLGTRGAAVACVPAAALAWAVASVDAALIDQINIYQASRLAMRDAVMRLTPAADHLLVDAMRLDCEVRQDPIIHGDALSASIAAASILAKVERDRMMCEWDPVYPEYGLASHKGYSTPRHLAALREHGPTPLHRQSFAPVWKNPTPQDAFGFMQEDEEPAVIASL